MVIPEKPRFLAPADFGPGAVIEDAVLADDQYSIPSRLVHDDVDPCIGT